MKFITAIIFIFTASMSQAWTSEAFNETMAALRSVGIDILHMPQDQVNQGMMGYIEYTHNAANIYIDPNMNFKDQSETLMHEAIHAIQWCINPRLTETIASDMSTLKPYISDETKLWAINLYDSRDYDIEMEAESFALKEWHWPEYTIVDQIKYFCKGNIQQ